MKLMRYHKASCISRLPLLGLLFHQLLLNKVTSTDLGLMEWIIMKNKTDGSKTNKQTPQQTNKHTNNQPNTPTPQQTNTPSNKQTPQHTTNQPTNKQTKQKQKIVC